MCACIKVRVRLCEMCRQQMRAGQIGDTMKPRRTTTEVSGGLGAGVSVGDKLEKALGRPNGNAAASGAGPSKQSAEEVRREKKSHREKLTALKKWC